MKFLALLVILLSAAQIMAGCQYHNNIVIEEGHADRAMTQVEQYQMFMYGQRWSQWKKQASRAVLSVSTLFRMSATNPNFSNRYKRVLDHGEFTTAPPPLSFTTIIMRLILAIALFTVAAFALPVDFTIPPLSDEQKAAINSAVEKKLAELPQEQQDAAHKLLDSITKAAEENPEAFKAAAFNNIPESAKQQLMNLKAQHLEQLKAL